jgi:hypothetical protein
MQTELKKRLVRVDLASVTPYSKANFFVISAVIAAGAIGELFVANLPDRERIYKIAGGGFAFFFAWAMLSRMHTQPFRSPARMQRKKLPMLPHPYKCWQRLQHSIQLAPMPPYFPIRVQSWAFSTGAARSESECPATPQVSHGTVTQDLPERERPRTERRTRGLGNASVC